MEGSSVAVSDPTPVLEINEVSKHFGAVKALTDVSFDIHSGEIHALVGENGAGKSTLVSIITGLQPASSGTLLLRGQEVQFRNPLDARAAGVSAVYQDPNLFPHLTVAENIYAGRYSTRGPFVDKRSMERSAREVLEGLGFDIDPSRVVAGLTVAEAQFVEIARAVSSDLDLLILDEPTSALTPGEAEKLYGVVRNLREQGTAVIWISHRMEEIKMLSDRITVLRDGGHVTTRDAADLEHNEMIRLMVGRDVLLERVPPTEPFGEPRLTVRGLSSPGMFDDISFEVRAGEIVGVAGLVGAGRSEIAQAIFGLDPRATGTIEVDGKKVTPKNPKQMANHGVIYLPEDRDLEGVIAEMTIKDNIALTAIDSLSTAGVVRGSAERLRALQQKESLSIKGDIGSPVNSLSGGNRQKVALARWLANEPRVLLLDEPTHGIDVGTKADVHDLMRALARKAGVAILMVSSDLPEVLAVSDRILVISRGRMTAELSADSATQETILAAATRTTSEGAK